MKNLTVEQARAQLTHVAGNVLRLSIADLESYLRCAPVNYATAVGPYRDKVRRLRNSIDGNSDRWQPASDPSCVDQQHDTEEMKLMKDYLFICEYLRGSRSDQSIGGALAASVGHINKRSHLFSREVAGLWHEGLVNHICDVAYEIPTKGRQLAEMGSLYEIITDPSLSDHDAINMFSSALEATVSLKKHSDTDHRILAFFRIVADILSCVIFPIALIRAADSTYRTGTWNFFKPLSATIPRLSKEIIDDMKQPVAEESVQGLLQDPLIDQESNAYEPTTVQRCI
jgi:hypothetical protein